MNTKVLHSRTQMAYVESNKLNVYLGRRAMECYEVGTDRGKHGHLTQGC